MLRHLTAACLAAFVALNAAAPRIAAKPPDLPDDDPIIVTEPVETPKPEGVCPRCADRRMLLECDPKTMPSALENLQAMQKATIEIGLARKLSAAGHVMEAIRHLDEARKLCPSPSFARRAEEVMKEIGSARVAERIISSEETPCCETLVRIRNVGACYMTRIGTYCEKVQAVASKGCCCDKECAKQQRSVTIELSVNSDSGLTGSIVLNERNFDCEKGCESACPKCEKMHQAVMKRAQQKAAGVKEQVDGLLKACYFAVREGRNAKAADLARQAHALDPKRVEGDPLVYKLHLLAEKGQCEECETPRESSPACPKYTTDPVEDNVSLRPALPEVDPEIVPALDRVLTKCWVGADGFERIGVDFGSGREEQSEEGMTADEFEVQVNPPSIENNSKLDSDAKLEARIRAETKLRGFSQVEQASCCPCCAIAKEIGLNLLGIIRAPTNYDNGFIMFGLGTNGINVYALSKYAGMKILVQYQGGLPIVWVASDSAAR